MEPAIIVFTFLIAFFCSHTNAQFECKGTCYSGKMGPQSDEIFHNHRLKGFTYKNISTNSPNKCYSSCANDCRCKACQMTDSRCELLVEDKSSEADNFVAESGYVYYELNQIMYQGVGFIVNYWYFFFNEL